MSYQALSDLVREHAVDFLTIIEPNKESEYSEKLLSYLRLTNVNFRKISSTDHFLTFTSLSESQVQRVTVVVASHREEFYRIKTNLIPEFNIVALHGKDKHSTRDQGARRKYFFKLRKNIELAELEQGHDRSIVIGDFNSNPFDEEMESAEGFHALQCSSIAGKTTRIIDKEEHSIFYNPMLSIYGSSSITPASYYLNNNNYYSPHWHMLDQVIFRPSMLRYAKIKYICLPTIAGGNSLLNRYGQPDKQNFSDHLSVVCRMEFANG